MYNLSYHADAVGDLKLISTSDKKRIKLAIEAKLLKSPVLFGKPLQHSLQGLRSMRVGDYRVIFKLDESDIFIVLIAHRSIVYKKSEKRNI